MSDSKYLVFLHPEIIPYLKSLGIFEIAKINDSEYVSCSTIHPSLLPGFLDLTLPRIQDDQDFHFSVSLPARYVVYVCWAQNQAVDRILGFRSAPKLLIISPRHQTNSNEKASPNIIMRHDKYSHNPARHRIVANDGHSR